MQTAHLDDENVMSASNVVRHQIVTMQTKITKQMYLFVELFSKDKALLSDFLEHYVRLKWIANLDGSFINGSSSHETAKISIRVPVDRGSWANVSGTGNRRCARTDSKQNLPVSPKRRPGSRRPNPICWPLSTNVI